KGVLNDGKRVAASNWITGEGDWFLFRNLSTKAVKSHLGGYLNFRDLPGVSDFDGTLSRWTSKWVEGVETVTDDPVEVVGSSFVRRIKGEDPKLLGESGEGVLTLIGWDEPESFGISWNAKNRLFINGYRLLKGGINPRNGLVSGAFIDPETGQKAIFGGALLQKQGMVGGRFVRGEETGQILIEAND
ncbi:MAG: hypothetical protein KDM63_11595, partial [Verrucomicrobiae bacterium]|nr:hypothetical protein [Verrucomicrobiae bacterium]